MFKNTHISSIWHIAILGCLFSSAIGLPAHAIISDTFPARTRIALCPEYQFENVELTLQYTIGEDTELHLIEITSYSIDNATNTGEFDILLPANLGTTQIHISAYCVSSERGESKPSNSISVSNCDRLALIDSDNDGIPNSQEDINCDNYFTFGDATNAENVDTDGDGIRDLVEILLGFDPVNPGSSPRPYVFAGTSFDPDGDGTSNPVVWRVSNGQWYIRDFRTPGKHLSFPFGQPGDIPFSYSPSGGTSDVGVIRVNPTRTFLLWYFHGLGFQKSDGTRINSLAFGTFGDNNIIPGPWETPGVTNPAIATMYGDVWSFYIYLSDGSIRHHYWGGRGDLPRVQDYDGDGIFDIAVFRPSEGKSYVIQSTDGLGYIYQFGADSYDHSVRGDITGDGIDDVSFWEPLTGMFYTMTSDNGYDEIQAAQRNPDHYKEMQLGLYNIHVPLSWNYDNGRMLYTVVEHATGLRYIRENNDPDNPPLQLQWGLPGDAQG